MRKFPKSTIAALLAMLMLASCGTAGGSGEETTNADPGTSEVTTEAYKLPEADFNNETVNILLRSTSWTPNDIWAETETGEALNDAVYRRNRKIEEEFNVKIFAEVAPEATGPALNNYVSQFIMAGDAAYDLVMLRISDIVSLSLGGNFVNLLNEKNLDFTQPFWQYDKLMETTIANKLYYTTGLVTNAANALLITLFNKEIAAEYKLPDLYEIVREGEYTVDVVEEFSKKAANDIDGDGTIEETDQFGIVGQTNFALMLYYGSGEKMTVKDENDIPRIAVGSERSINVIQKMSKFFSAPEHTFIGSTAAIKNIWFNSRSLFYFASLSSCEEMRQYDFNFGLLPLPKYDTEQEEYVCQLNTHNPCGTAIPRTVDSNRASLILQAIACYSEDEVIPAFYDICLEGKSLRDDESAEMLDIIFESWHNDLSDAYSWSLSGAVGEAIRNGEGIASRLEEIRPVVEKSIEDTVKVLESLDV